MCAAALSCPIVEDEPSAAAAAAAPLHVPVVPNPWPTAGGGTPANTPVNAGPTQGDLKSLFARARAKEAALRALGSDVKYSLTDQVDQAAALQAAHIASTARGTHPTGVKRTRPPPGHPGSHVTWEAPSSVTGYGPPLGTQSRTPYPPLGPYPPPRSIGSSHPAGFTTNPTPGTGIGPTAAIPGTSSGTTRTTTNPFHRRWSPIGATLGGRATYVQDDGLRDDMDEGPPRSARGDDADDQSAAGDSGSSDEESVAGDDPLVALVADIAESLRMLVKVGLALPGGVDRVRALDAAIAASAVLPTARPAPAPAAGGSSSSTTTTATSQTAAPASLPNSTPMDI